MWLASPALPVGGFSYSEGLEAAVDKGLANDETNVAAWLVDQLHLGLARSDLVVLSKAMGAWRRDDVGDLVALNDWILQTRESSEMRQQTEQMGRSLALWRLQRDVVDTAFSAAITAMPALSWPVAFALAACRTGAPIREASLAFALGWAENMVQAALKSIPLGQNAGQRVLERLVVEIPGAVEHALARSTAERQAFMPMLAIVSAQHEAQYSRLFRS